MLLTRLFEANLFFKFASEFLQNSAKSAKKKNVPEILIPERSCFSTIF